MTYGHRASLDEPLQLCAFKLSGRIRKTDKALPGIPQRKIFSGVGARSRQAYFGRGHGWLDTAILVREDVKTERRGPFIIEEYDTTCVVPPDARARLDDYGNVVITMDAS